MVEQYNDQLRELRQNDITEVSAAFKETIRQLRDEERATEESVQVQPSSTIVNSFYFDRRISNPLTVPLFWNTQASSFPMWD